MGAEAWGHSVSDLLKARREKINVPDELVDGAKQLDRFYIPARYPNSWATGIPAEYIDRNKNVVAQFIGRLFTNVVRGFSLVHDLKRSHYENLIEAKLNSLYIDRKDALNAIDNSEKLLRFCASILAKQSPAQRETP